MALIVEVNRQLKPVIFLFVRKQFAVSLPAVLYLLLPVVDSRS